MSGVKRVKRQRATSLAGACSHAAQSLPPPRSYGGAGGAGASDHAGDSTMFGNIEGLPDIY